LRLAVLEEPDRKTKSILDRKFGWHVALNLVHQLLALRGLASEMELGGEQAV
jgi:hypothetical protein